MSKLARGIDPGRLAACAHSCRVLFRLPARLWAIGTPAIEASATVSPKAELNQRSFGTIESLRELKPGSLEALDTVARAVPVKCEDGRAFITLSRDQRFKIGVQLSRPNLVGIAMTSRWQ
jgi:hypothetical protein